MKNIKNQKGFSSIWLILIAVVIVLVSLFLFFKLNKNDDVSKSEENKDVLIGFSITTLQEERWQRDKEEFLKRAEELGVTVDLRVADNDGDRQSSQIEEMVINGVDAIVVVPYNADALSDVIKKAKDLGIKVLSYDRLIKNSDVDMYISFDNEKVGEIQAEYVINKIKDRIDSGEKLKIGYTGGSERDNNSFLLRDGSMNILKPLVDNGSIEIVYNNFTKDWNPDVAYLNVKEYLSKNNGLIDGVVAANDGTAFGVITALKEYGLEGKVPVSGQDAELAALQRIVKGSQTVTVYKPVSLLAKSAVESALKLINGEEINYTGYINDGEFDIPAYLIEPIAVTIDNIEDTVIKDGYHKKEDIYRNF